MVTLIFFELTLAFNFRSFRKGVLNRGLFINKYLFYATAISVMLTFIIIYTPLSTIFETTPIGIEGLVIPLASSFLLIIIYDLLKYVNKRTGFVDFERS